MPNRFQDFLGVPGFRYVVHSVEMSALLFDKSMQNLGIIIVIICLYYTEKPFSIYLLRNVQNILFYISEPVDKKIQSYM